MLSCDERGRGWIQIEENESFGCLEDNQTEKEREGEGREGEKERETERERRDAVRNFELKIDNEIEK